jgi:NDP-sugar pyrophosphorylase family protein
MNVPALILCGGYGTRMRDVSTTPKCFLTIGDKSILQHTENFLFTQGLFKQTAVIHESFAPYIDRIMSKDSIMRFAEEAERKGTAGAVKTFAPVVGEDRTFVLNGDTILDIDLKDMLAWHNAWGAKVTMAGEYREDAWEYGIVKKGNEIPGAPFKTRTIVDPAPYDTPMDFEKRGMACAGCYIINREIIDLLPEEGNLDNAIDQLTRDHVPVFVYGKCRFMDTGTPERFERAQRMIEDFTNNPKYTPYKGLKHG